MKHIIFALFSLLLFSCEKAFTEDVEPEEKTEPKEELPDMGEVSDDEDVDTTNYRRYVHTVREFINSSRTGQIWVEGYIVGVCTRNIANADFIPPFDDVPGLLLADDKNETDISQVITIKLHNQTIRGKLNLKDNPSNKGRRLRVFGVRQTYLSVIGIKTIDAYELMP